MNSQITIGFNAKNDKDARDFIKEIINLAKKHNREIKTSLVRYGEDSLIQKTIRENTIKEK